MRSARVKYFIMFMGLAASLLPATAQASGPVIRLATTTSTENSGLLDFLLPAFTQETGIQVMVLPKGTGAALRDGRDGNVDVVLVHAARLEEAFVAEGHGAYRLAVMHNDFVIVGPPSDPAGIRGMRDAARALRRIGESRSPFVSRGDGSGTHIKEQELWEKSGLPLKREVARRIKGGRTREEVSLYPGGMGKWYLSIGQGMGKALLHAEEKRAYTLSDRGTFLKYRLGRGGGLDLEILCEGDPRLENPYGVIPINPKKHPHVRFDLAERFAKWLVSPEGQRRIAQYRIAGHQAFFPDALPASHKGP